MKKLLAVILSLALTVFIFPLSALAEDVQTEPVCGGVIPLTQEEIDALLVKESPAKDVIRSSTNLPSSVDHSTTQYFPVIGDQG